MTTMSLEQACLLAVKHQSAGRLQEAEHLCRLILTQAPGQFVVMQLLGQVNGQMGHFDAAFYWFHRSIALQPDCADAYSDLGNTLISAGRFGEAVAACRRAIELQPDSIAAHYNLGCALLQVGGQLDEAVTALQKGLLFTPSLVEMEKRLGPTPSSDLHSVLEVPPGTVAAYNNLGNAFKEKGELDRAIAMYRCAIALDPGYQLAHDNLLLLLPYHPAYDAKTIAWELQQWNQQHAEPLRKNFKPHLNDTSTDRRLRVGYISGDFCSHAVAHYLYPLLRHHDRKQIDLFCYSQTHQLDSLHDRFLQIPANWRNLVSLTDAQVVRQITEDRIDILVDLNLHSANNRLLVFANKPAPVQLTFAGYPGSTGLTAIDYRLSDCYLDPVGMDESIYSETTVRLPHSFWCYDPMEKLDVPVNQLPALNNGFVTFGCLNSFYKINDQTLGYWAQIMQQVTDSRLLLMAPPGDHRQRTLDRLSRDGIDQSRVEFVDRQSTERYLKLYHRIDVGLDTFPYNGHTTSLDSLLMGVPVMTFAGERAVARAGWCQLSNLQLTELAGETPAGFIALTIDLARNLPRLKNLRSILRQKLMQSPLTDHSAFSKNLESIYRRLWQTWCEKQKM